MSCLYEKNENSSWKLINIEKFSFGAITISIWIDRTTQYPEQYNRMGNSELFFEKIHDGVVFGTLVSVIYKCRL